MKKRMLLSTVLMTLVLLLAVTTATFAWYTATSGTVSKSYTEVKVVTSSDTVTLGNLKIVVTATPASDVGPSCYAGEMINDAAQSAGDVFYIVDGKTIETTAGNMGYQTSGAITFSVKVLDSNDSDITSTLTAEQKAMLDASDYSFTLSGSGLRFGSTGDAAVSGQNANITVSVTFDASGSASFSDVYYAVNSSVTGTSTQISLVFN